MLDSRVIETIAWKLSVNTDQSTDRNEDGTTQDCAFLVADGTVYFNRMTRPIPGTPAWMSPVVNLIQGIYDCHDQPRKLLRQRIYTTSTPTAMCLGMIKVAAKRMTAEIVPRRHAIDLASDLTHFEEIKPLSRLGPSLAPNLNFLPASAHSLIDIQAMAKECVSDLDFMRLANRLAQESKSASGEESPRHLRDRPIAALLVSGLNSGLVYEPTSGAGEILAWAVNTNRTNKTLHSEVNMIQHYCRSIGGPVPIGSRIYTTLKPCKMCAGMIWTAAEDIQKIIVYYGEDDPGPHAKVTMLSQTQRYLPITGCCAGRSRD
jgi:tRNA(Arg) A34 adenosine deaminase TadA